MKLKNPSPAQVAFLFRQHGMPGDPIKDSGWVRGYCPLCWTPMRTDGPEEVHCKNCGGRRPPAPKSQLTERQRTTLRKMR